MRLGHGGTRYWQPQFNQAKAQSGEIATRICSSNRLQSDLQRWPKPLRGALERVTLAMREAATALGADLAAAGAAGAPRISRRASRHVARMPYCTPNAIASRITRAAYQENVLIASDGSVRGDRAV
jgi:hypothetical protein